MIKRGTLVLLLIFLALLAGTLYWQRVKLNAPAEATPTVEKQYLFNMGGSGVVRIQLSGPETKAIVLEKDSSGTWFINNPQTTEADATKIESVLGQLDSIQISSTPELLSTLEQIGLDPPNYGVVLDLEDGKQLVANIGKETPTKSGYYVLTNDRYVVIVGKSYIDTLIGLLDNPPYLPTPTPIFSVTPVEVTSTP